ncbi:MAG: chemotaxis protein CheW [Planococcaceae bacterium]|uniref:chemotaxis protein CheW n=1 Tax=Paenisporosarcina quisquiliarum TaxID=365346 RepID=UPI0024241C3F|nr:chemotaxis protein CheW [Bacillota bacterium]MDX1771614.1 chemotaxis protein CheW [Planococcaceae bacterium]
MTELKAMDDLKVIVFELMNKEYVIPVSQVQSIEKMMHITRVPKTPSFVKGVINLRGVVTPIIDLRERFNLQASEANEQSRMIMIKLEDMEVGLIVDAANDVLDIPLSAIEPQPDVVGSIESEFIGGVAKLERRLLVMLQLEKVLNPIKQAI